MVKRLKTIQKSTLAESIPIEVSKTISYIGNNTYRAKLGNDDIEIGDYSKTTFMPSIKLFRWDRECSMDISLSSISGNIKAMSDEQITWQSSGMEIEFYVLDPTDQFEYGGFEFNVVLLSAPLTNVVELDIKYNNLIFTRQLSLTEDSVEITRRFGKNVTIRDTEVWKDGRRVVQCPENVIHSYSVKHSDKRDNAYMTGKAFHIYRPMLVDSIGQTVWAEIEITSTKMIITIPPDFLARAVYPIRHAVGATFGKTAQGAKNAANDGAMDSYVHTCTTAGTYTREWMALTGNAGAGRVGMYDVSGGDPNNLLDESNSLTINTLSTNGNFYELNLITGVGCAASTDYYLALQLNASADNFYYDDNGGINIYRTWAYGAFEDPWTTKSSGTWDGSIYAETAPPTPTGGATAPFQMNSFGGAFDGSYGSDRVGGG